MSSAGAMTRIVWLLSVALQMCTCNSSSSVTVKGQAAGSFTFNTVFEPKLCSKLEAADLPHLSSMEVTVAREAIEYNLGGHSKCIVVFGVLVISNIRDNGNFINDDWVRLFANTIAFILDRNKDGAVDDPAVANLMKSRGGTAMSSEDGGTWIFARSKDTTDEAEDALINVIGRTTAILQDEDFTPESEIGHTMRAMTEEIFHTYQHKLGDAYPKIWGVSSAGCPGDFMGMNFFHIAHGQNASAKWRARQQKRRMPLITPGLTPMSSLANVSGRHFLHSAANTSKRWDECENPDPDAQKGCNYEQSTLMKCAFQAQCNWYTAQICCSKTGDSASGANVNGGGCLWPGCAGVEWYYNLIFEYSETNYPTAPQLQGAGEYDMGHYLDGGNSFPQNRAEAKQRLSSMGGACADVLKNIENPKYHQLTAPFDWNYAPNAVGKGSFLNSALRGTSNFAAAANSHAKASAEVKFAPDLLRQVERHF